MYLRVWFLGVGLWAQPAAAAAAATPEALTTSPTAEVQLHQETLPGHRLSDSGADSASASPPRNRSRSPQVARPPPSTPPRPAWEGPDSRSGLHHSQEHVDYISAQVGVYL